MINVSEEQLRIIQNIIKKHIPESEVRVFGSRYKWTNREYSDLDLVVVGEKEMQIADLMEAFEESDLPFRVDVLNWHAIKPEFRKIIDQGYEVIWNGQSKLQAEMD